MYLKQFKLKEEPFTTTPDPRFLYHSEMHEKALDRLKVAITNRRGITALIGEPGLGKSTLLRTVLSGLQESMNFAWVFNTTMAPIDLLKFICRDFGFTPKSDNKSDLLMELYAFFVREYEQNRFPLLIIDEAQNLSCDALEEIRQLSNLETVNKKLVQIILCGQPQLEINLERPEMVQLRQRISYKAKLSRLTFDETVAYIRFRLSVAGAPEVGLFTQNALKEIFETSGGIPRLINHLCDDALQIAAKNGTSRVETKIIRTLVDSGDIMRAPSLKSFDIKEEKKPVIIRAAKQALEAKTIKKPKSTHTRRHTIETEYDLFEAIDLAELLTVI